MTERRTARRYDLSLPVSVRLPINREPGAHDGQTRDISTRGVYFIMAKDLAPGTEVDFTLTLPAEITRGTEVFVRAHGRVVRVESLAVPRSLFEPTGEWFALTSKKTISVNP